MPKIVPAGAPAAPYPFRTIQDKLRPDGFEIRQAGEYHRKLRLLPQHLQDPPHPACAAHGEPPERGPAHEGAPRTQR